VVEDEGHLADVMVEALEAHGLVVETAGNGRTAKERLSSRAYDLIISDLKMPQMNGREFYRYVAAAQPALARRIIFSTGDTASPETQAFFQEVGNPFLAKPFNLTELIRVVDSVLARS
jgi:CheY-like chemotaxis protein